MNGILKNIDYKKIFYYFEEISNIPRGSKNNLEISNYLAEFAKNHGLEYFQDEFLNVVIIKEATAGYEACPTVILQGHMDMVCEKNADTIHDFLKEPLELKVEGDYIFAEGTTLGGDDGIAVAYALAILDSNEYEHPRLEVVITTDEEIGMDGAIGLDTSILKGKYMINIDSEEEGIFLSSSAGGLTGEVRLPIERESFEGKIVNISILGLKGGHSGTEINKGHINSNILMGRLLYDLKELLEYRLYSVDGGLKDNAIPREAKAVIMINDKDADKLVKYISLLENQYKSEFSANEEGLNIKYDIGSNDIRNTFKKDVKEKVIFFLNQSPNGVQVMSQSIEGLVESSLNLGVLRTDEKEIIYFFSIRSSVNSYKTYLSNKLNMFAEFLGGSYKIFGEYPAWEYKPDSKLRQLFKKIYEIQYGKEPVIMAIHAGLECGIIAGKIENLDIISLGPDILDIHTPKERLSISSAKRVFDYVLKVLKEFKEIK